MPNTWPGNSSFHRSSNKFKIGLIKPILICFFLMIYVRFKREEVKIQAWENHQKRKAEMEMKKVEVMVLLLSNLCVIILL